MKKLMLMLMLLCSPFVFAGTMKGAPLLPWHFNATLGYTHYQDMVDSNIALQRISGSRDVLAYGASTLGIELGVQTGLSSRLSASEAELNLIGLAATEMVINPFVDVLGTLSIPVGLIASELAVFSKVGIAYRQMHFDNNLIHRKVAINPEVQVGFNLSLSSQASIALAYQGIYAKRARLTLHQISPSVVTGTVRSIPTQNAILVIFGWSAA